MPKLDKLTEFERFIKTLSNEKLGELVREYVEESNHGGWDGYARQDLTGIRKFLEDLSTYYNSARSIVKAD